MTEKDKGSHYRNGMHCPGCNRPIAIDPYRVDNIVGPLPGPLFHIMKKSMRGTSKGHTHRQICEEILCCAERWKDVLKENGEWQEPQDGNTECSAQPSESILDQGTLNPRSS